MAAVGDNSGDKKRTRKVTSVRGRRIEWVPKLDADGDPIGFVRLQFDGDTEDAVMDRPASTEACVSDALDYFSSKAVKIRGHKISKSDTKNGKWAHQMQSMCVEEDCTYQERIEIGHGFEGTHITLMCNDVDCTHQQSEKSNRGLSFDQKAIIDKWRHASKNIGARTIWKRWLSEKPEDEEGVKIPVPAEKKVRSYCSNTNYAVNKAAPPDNVTTVEQWGKYLFGFILSLTSSILSLPSSNVSLIGSIWFRLLLVSATLLLISDKMLLLSDEMLTFSTALLFVQRRRTISTRTSMAVTRLTSTTTSTLCSSSRRTRIRWSTGK